MKDCVPQYPPYATYPYHHHQHPYQYWQYESIGPNSPSLSSSSHQTDNRSPNRNPYHNGRPITNGGSHVQYAEDDDDDEDDGPRPFDRKMFIGGLSWQTTPENLKTYFQQYGEVLECMIMKDAITKRSRGFGFITFKDATAVDKVLAKEQHMLDEKQ
ncbi:unnamed protein product, partial [Didymodactylos carnosus]